MALVICFCTSLATALVAACVAACCSWLPIDPIASWIPPTACCAPGCGRGRWLRAGGHGDQRGGEDGSRARGDSRRETESRRECEKETDGKGEERVYQERGGGSRRGMRLREKERDEINNELAPSEIRRSRVGDGSRDVGRGLPRRRRRRGGRDKGRITLKPKPRMSSVSIC